MNKLHRQLTTLASILGIVTACGPAPIDEHDTTMAASAWSNTPRSSAPDVVPPVTCATTDVSWLSAMLVEVPLAANDTAASILGRVAPTSLGAECTSITRDTHANRLVIGLDNCPGPKGVSYSGTVIVDVSVHRQAASFHAEFDVSGGGESIAGTADIERPFDRNGGVFELGFDINYDDGMKVRHVSFSGTMARDRSGQTIDGTGAYNDGTVAGAFEVEGLHHPARGCYPDGGQIRASLSAPTTATIIATMDAQTAETGGYNVCYIKRGHRICETQQLPWDCGR